MSAPRSQRSLLNVWSALGLMLCTGGAFAAIFPLSRDREVRALTGAPDMLALSYLELALSRAPTDESLRVRVAERTLDAGRFDRARALLAPLPAEHSAAAALRVEIDYRAWAAVDADDARLRSIGLARLSDRIEHTDSARLSLESAERMAWIAGQAGLRARRARILDALARVDLGNDDRLRAADGAWLELNDPLAAAELRAARALALPDRNGRVQASIALRRALASGQPGPTLVLFRQLRPRYAHEARVLELGLAALAGVDDVEALGVARELLELRPDDAALRERIAALDAWTRGAPNVPEAPLPVRPEPLRWDYGSGASADVPESDGRAPQGSARAIELAALYESLGSPEQALARLDAALVADEVDERALWDLKVGVLLRSGDRRGALSALEQMADRFGESDSSLRRRADLLLGLGELDAALELLDSAPGPRDVADERRITAIGWELGDVARVRDAYRVIVRSSEATPDDVRRLWLLERDGGDLSAGARAALAGYERFAELDLLKLALHTAVEAKDDALIEAALDAGEKHGAHVDDAESVELQVGVRQQRAYRALLEHQPERARA
ncbi:MAG TPA: tetratricopeptide repeat protein, partial [Polyangiaceae bacterium]|nr:tetratricopeptide repeat protein [Polyangiaceae bacterium]